MAQRGKPFGVYVDGLTDTGAPDAAGRVPIVESGVPRRVDADQFGGGGGGGTPATTVTSENVLNDTAPAVGTDTEYARQDHTHGTPPMPSAGDVGAATAAEGALAVAALPKVQTFRAVAGTTDTLVLGDMDNIVRSTGASACTITVPPASSVAWVVGRSIRIRGAGAGIVTLAAGSGVTLNATPSLVFRAQHSEAVITYVGSDEWDVSGDMATP